MILRRLALFALLSLVAPVPALAGDVLVFAAASLRGAMDQVAEAWQAETGHSVTLSYAGSSALARQILAGAPADIFVSAAPVWMDVIDAQGLSVAGSRVDILGNTLVLIAHGAVATVPLDADFDLLARLGDGRLAMALVDAVPAGQYGKAALQTLGLWEAVAPQVAQADNVRAALALVAVGEAPLGIVYASDAAAEPRVSVLGIFAPGSHDVITYPAALLSEADDPAAAAFLQALQQPDAQAIFAAQGFVILDQP